MTRFHFVKLGLSRFEAALDLVVIFCALALAGCTPTAFSTLPASGLSSSNPFGLGLLPASPGGLAVPGSSSSTSDSGPSLTVAPDKVCGPQVTPSEQAILATTSNVTAVLFQANNFAIYGAAQSNGPTVVQAWDSPAQTSAVRAALMQSSFQLPLAAKLAPGTYALVLFDSSKQSAPYQYAWNQIGPKAVAPILDSVAGELDASAVIAVDANGNVTQPHSFNLLFSLQPDPACQGLGDIDPLMINLGPGAIALSSPAQGVSIDLKGTGQAERVSWPLQPALAAFLVNDSANGGAIGPAQLFGNYTVGPDGKTAVNGYEALRKYDRNGDGAIDANDAIWPSLKLWTDLNRNGLADPGELVPLAQAGIVRIILPRLSSTRLPASLQNCQADAYNNLVCSQAGASALVAAGNGKVNARQLVDIDFAAR